MSWYKRLARNQGWVQRKEPPAEFPPEAALKRRGSGGEAPPRYVVHHEHQPKERWVGGTCKHNSHPPPPASFVSRTSKTATQVWWLGRATMEETLWSPYPFVV